MKNLRCFTAILLIATMFANFSCSSDDDDDKKEENLIVGKWKVMESGYTDEIMEYKANGTFEYFYVNDGYSETGIYKIESGKLYLMWDEDDIKDWDIYKIHELNSISLMIEEYDEKGNLYGYKESFQRIK